MNSVTNKRIKMMQLGDFSSSEHPTAQPSGHRVTEDLYIDPNSIFRDL